MSTEIGIYTATIGKKTCRLNFTHKLVIPYQKGFIRNQYKTLKLYFIFGKLIKS